MFLSYPSLLVLSFGFLITATPLQLTEDNRSKLPEILSIVQATVPSNTTNPALEPTAENSFTIHCDGEKYGYRPSIRDCEGAREVMVPDTRIWTLGERRTGLPTDIVPLPYRVMGDRAICYVEPVLIGDHRTAQASLNMIRRAAGALIVQCATNSDSQGGIATNIGTKEAKLVAKGAFGESHVGVHPMADARRWRQQPSRNSRNVRKADFLPQNSPSLEIMQRHSVSDARRQATASVRSTRRSRRHTRPSLQYRIT